MRPDASIVVFTGTGPVNAAGEQPSRRRCQKLLLTAGCATADGLAARIGLESAARNDAQPPVLDLSDAFAALDEGEYERGLDLLIGALPNADGARDDVRRVIVGILDELVVGHPLARDARRRLASALY